LLLLSSQNKLIADFEPGLTFGKTLWEIRSGKMESLLLTCQ
jgi:ABC-type cobalt transport system substrate-binding protein